MTRERAGAQRGPRVRRGLVVSVLLLFVGALAAEVFALHDCPHHHPSAAPAAGHGRQPVADETEPANETEPTNHTEGPCCCPGACDTESAPAPLANSAPRLIAPPPHASLPMQRAVERGFRAPPGVFLPPSTAPPHLRHA